MASMETALLLIAREFAAMQRENQVMRREMTALRELVTA